MLQSWGKYNKEHAERSKQLPSSAKFALVQTRSKNTRYESGRVGDLGGASAASSAGVAAKVDFFENRRSNTPSEQRQLGLRPGQISRTPFAQAAKGEGDEVPKSQYTMPPQKRAHVERAVDCKKKLKAVREQNQEHHLPMRDILPYARCAGESRYRCEYYTMTDRGKTVTATPTVTDLVGPALLKVGPVLETPLTTTLEVGRSPEHLRAFPVFEMYANPNIIGNVNRTIGATKRTASIPHIHMIIRVYSQRLRWQYSKEWMSVSYSAKPS